MAKDSRRKRKLKDSAQKALNKGKHEKALDAYLELEKIEAVDGAWPRRAADMYRRLKRHAEAVLALERAADKYARAGFLVKAVAVCKLILQADPDHSATQKRLAELQESRGIPAVRPGRQPVPAAPAEPVAAAPSARPPTPEPFEIQHTAEPVAAAAPPPGAIDLEIEPDAEELEIVPTGHTAQPPPAPEPIEIEATAGQMPSGVEIAIERAGMEEPPREVALPLEQAPDLAEGAGPPPVDVPADVRARRRTIPPGAPLDQVALGEIVPGSQPEVRPDGTESGITDIPLELELEDLEELMVEAEAAVEAPADSAAREAALSLQETPLFSALGPESLQSFINKIDLVELAKGETLFRQGEPGHTLFVIAEGAVAVISEGPPRVQLSKLGEGDFFGEIALVTEQARSATIEALEETQLLAIDRDVIGDLVEDEPEVLRVILRFLRDRLVSSLIHTSPLFGPFEKEHRKELAAQFRFLEVETDSVLVEQGVKADGLFVMLSGHAEVAMKTETGESRRLATLGPGDLCGEMSLLASGPAVATVRTTSKSFALKLPDRVFRQLIMTHPQVLMFVHDLAEERQRTYDAILAGDADYEEGHLDLV